MAITMAVGDDAIAAAKAAEEQNEPEPQASLDLIARKSADGNIMIMDHTDIDVVILPQKNKVLALAKNHFTDDVYDSQDRLFKYLSKKGLVDLASIRSGNVYGSLEAAYIGETFNGADPIETIVYGVGKFMEEEKPYFAYNQKLEKDETQRISSPEDSTSLGQVPHEREKGTLPKDPHGGNNFASVNPGPSNIAYSDSTGY